MIFDILCAMRVTLITKLLTISNWSPTQFYSNRCDVSQDELEQVKDLDRIIRATMNGPISASRLAKNLIRLFRRTTLHSFCVVLHSASFILLAPKSRVRFASLSSAPLSHWLNLFLAQAQVSPTILLRRTWSHLKHAKKECTRDERHQEGNDAVGEIVEKHFSLRWRRKIRHAAWSS